MIMFKEKKQNKGAREEEEVTKLSSHRLLHVVKIDGSIHFHEEIIDNDDDSCSSHDDDNDDDDDDHFLNWHLYQDQQQHL
jgi:hypothetical protein